ncbi:MAG: putative metal-dependent hydrolase [Bacteroidetes bacterium]|nr:putative metal-dependent hydrolase [Bacteroidota bacterium]
MSVSNFDPIVFPIGEYTPAGQFNRLQINKWIAEVNQLPTLLTKLSRELNESFLDSSLRSSAWTIRQLIHHIADSHHHAYTRFKWTLTENEPMIKAYDEKAWSKLSDATAPIKLSLDHLSAVHRKWVFLLEKMNENDFSKRFQHPETKSFHFLYDYLGVYAWHGNHHLAQIKEALAKFNQD